MRHSKKTFALILTVCLTLVMGLASVSVSAATKPTKLYLSATASTVDINGKITVKVSKAKPSKASKSVTWTSSNKKVATITSKGVVTGKKAGKVTITAVSKLNKKVKATKTIYVKDLKSTSITLDKKSAELYETAGTTVKATVKGAVGFYNQGVTWKSSNSKVATVDSKGNIKAVAAGTANIIATEKGGTRTATCTVTVKTIPSSESFGYGDKQVYVDPLYVAAAQKEGKKIVLIDAGWGEGYTTSAHIPGAVHVNTDAVEYDDCDPWPYGDGFDDFAIYDKHFTTDADGNVKTSGGYVNPDDNMNIRSADQLKKLMKMYGITQDTEVVIYNKKNNSAAARVALAMLYYGVDKVRVVDGGQNKWDSLNLPTETKENQPDAGGIFWSFGDGTYPAHPELIKSIDDVKNQLIDNPDDNFRLVSIRSREEFEGKESGYGYIDYAGEPHGAVWGEDEASYFHDDRTAISYNEMKTLLAKYGTNIDKNETSFYCGTGWRAAVPALIAYQNGNTNVSIYDGGWMQWQYRWQQDSKAYPIQKITPEQAAVLPTLAFKKKSIEIEVGETFDAYTNLDITGIRMVPIPTLDEKFTSDDTSVATVNENGVITGVRKGVAQITVSITNLNTSVSMAVKVIDADKTQFITAKEMYKELGNDKLVFLDSRDKADYEAGHIPTAVSASVRSAVKGDTTDGDAADNVQAVVDQYGKDKKYAVICYSGNSYAKKATTLLEEAGVDASNIYTLGDDNGERSSNGGQKAWVANYPDYIATSGASTTGKYYFNDNITLDQLNKDRKGDQKYLIIDLRAYEDYVSGHLPDALSAPCAYKDENGKTAQRSDDNPGYGLHIPLSNIVNTYPDRIYVVQCYSGNTYADLATTYLRDKLGVPEGRIITLTGGFKAVTEAGETLEHYDADEASNFVAISATVKNVSTPTMHYVVNEKGSMAEKSILTTAATNAEFYEALTSLGATPWDSKTTVTDGKDEGKAGSSSIKELVAAGIGNKNFSKIDVFVEPYGGESYSLAETVNGAQDQDMIFANRNNNQNAKFGCITCLTSCYSGMVANQNTTWASANYGQANTDILKEGDSVLVFYRVKE